MPLPQPLEENGQVVMIVKLLNLDLPLPRIKCVLHVKGGGYLENVAGWAVLDRHREVPAIIEPPQQRYFFEKVMANLNHIRDWKVEAMPCTLQQRGGGAQSFWAWQLQFVRITRKRVNPFS